MNTWRFTAKRRRKSGHVHLVIVCELDEDSYARGPFLRFRADPQPFARSFELCFHHGWPEAPPKSGRMVQFEHLVPDLPEHVHFLRIFLANGDCREIRSTQPHQTLYGRPPRWER